MCEWHGGTYEGNVLVKLAHPKENGIEEVAVDACIAPLVQAINNAGIQTLNSCCGHGVRPGWIALEDGKEILIAPDWETARKMDSGFPSLTKQSGVVKAITAVDRAIESARKIIDSI